MLAWDTRRELFYDIWKWIYSADETKTAEILWLCDVAGAGKSAIAHTVARNVSTRVYSAHPFSSIETSLTEGALEALQHYCRDLVRLSNDLVGHVSQILENDRSVASAGQSRQFDELILKPAFSTVLAGLWS
jgi:hypothetical protein